jgi:hypothetical protein
MDPYVQQMVTAFNAQNVVDYSQGDDTRLQDDPVLTGNGWCFAMSVHWLVARQHGWDFWAWLRTAEAVSKIRFIMARQAIGFTKMANSWVDGSQAANGYLNSQGLSRLDSPASMNSRASHGGSTTAIRDKMTLTSGQGALLKMSGRAPHAMACWVKPDGNAIFMDPNAGEFEFLSAQDFRNFFRHLMAEWKLFRAGSSVASYCDMDPTFRVDKYAGGGWRQSGPQMAAPSTGLVIGQRQPPRGRGIVIGRNR